jgi:hypothetical protein
MEIITVVLMMLYFTIMFNIWTAKPKKMEENV